MLRKFTHAFKLEIGSEDKPNMSFQTNFPTHHLLPAAKNKFLVRTLVVVFYYNDSTDIFTNCNVKLAPRREKVLWTIRELQRWCVRHHQKGVKLLKKIILGPITGIHALYHRLTMSVKSRDARITTLKDFVSTYKITLYLIFFDFT